MPLEIEENLKKYVTITEDKERIEKFVCPVPGCDYSNIMGPGALRMHIISKHEDQEGYGLSLGDVQTLYKLPRVS